jgi:hypothetical protein
MTVIWRRVRLLPALLMGVVLLAPSPAIAQDGGEPPDDAPAVGSQWAVEPSGPEGPGLRPNFAYNLEPGQVIQDVVAISNLTDEPIDFEIYAKDAYNTPRDAAFALDADEETSTGVGTWITFGQPAGGPASEDGILRYTLSPRTRVDVPFQITVPEDAEPGDHAGGILAANASPLPGLDSEGVSIQLRHRVAARVYVRVDGPVTPALRVDQIGVDTSMPIVPWLTGKGDATLTYTITNVGNIRLEPLSATKVKGLFGRTLRSFPIRELPELLPGASVVITEEWSGLPPIEPLNIEIALESVGGEVSTTRSHGFFVWSWAAVALGVVILLTIGYRLWRRRHPRAERAEGPKHRARSRLAQAPADDTPDPIEEQGADLEVDSPDESEPAHAEAGAASPRSGP